MKNISVEKVYFLQGISNFVGSKFVKKELTKCFFCDIINLVQRFGDVSK